MGARHGRAPGGGPYPRSMTFRPDDSRLLRVVRAGTAAGIATTVAGTAHTLSGGGAPPAWLMLVVTLLAWPVALILIGARPSGVRTGAAIVAAQGILHGAFAMVGTGTPRGIGAHTHGSVALALGSSGALPVDPEMIAGHLAAAAVTIALVAHGESLLRTIAAGIRALLPTVPAAPAVAALPPRTGAQEPARPYRRLLPSPLSRRGPPN